MLLFNYWFYVLYIFKSTQGCKTSRNRLLKRIALDVNAFECLINSDISLFFSFENNKNIQPIVIKNLINDFKKVSKYEKNKKKLFGFFWLAKQC